MSAAPLCLSGGRYPSHRIWTGKYPAIAAALTTLPSRQAYFDGELCGVPPDGVTSFALIQNAAELAGRRQPRLFRLRTVASRRPQSNAAAAGGPQGASRYAPRAASVHRWRFLAFIGCVPNSWSRSGHLTWSDDGLLRQVVYEGIREDKPAREVVRPPAATGADPRRKF